MLQIAGRKRTQTQVSGATGSNAGTMTDNGGLAAAFDGTTSKANTACCAAATSVSGYNNTVGKNWGAGVKKAIGRFQVYGPNNTGLLGAAGGSTLKLQGSQDNASWDDLYTSGTVLASSAQSIDVTTGITIIPYQYHRINVNGNGANAALIAQVVLFEDV